LSMMQGRGEPSDAGHLSATHVSRASRARPASRALVGVDEKLPCARRVLVGNTAHAQLRARLAATHGAHDAINHVPGHRLYAEGLLVLDKDGHPAAAEIENQGKWLGVGTRVGAGRVGAGRVGWRVLMSMCSQSNSSCALRAFATAGESSERYRPTFYRSGSLECLRTEFATKKSITSFSSLATTTRSRHGMCCGCKGRPPACAGHTGVRGSACARSAGPAQLARAGRRRVGAS